MSSSQEVSMSTLLAIGTRKGLWLASSNDDRRTWSISAPHFLMNEVASVAIDNRRDVTRLLVGTSSEHWGPSVMRSDDLGASWQETERGSIQFPADTGATLARVWQLQPDSPDRPDIVWAGCEPTSLWRSVNGGASFDLVRGLWDHPHRTEWEPGFGGAAVHTVIPDPTSSRVLAAMSTGGVYITDDGDTWAPSNHGISAVFMPDPYPEFGQCVHKVATSNAGTERLYAQNHHGVYRSDDGGGRWTSIADGLPADFGFPVLAHPNRPDTAWVVPLVADAQRVPPEGKLRVHRTRDGGESWQELGSGLPDAAWTVVLRDAACVDNAEPTGIYLGTRDGCVYGSADEGDHFSLIAAHLPDVLCVRAVEIT
jgi:hypothetical protein